jgi:hypothetical protein
MGKTAKVAALLTEVNIRTAHHYIKKYNDDEERRLPIRDTKPGNGHKAIAITILGIISQATVTDISVKKPQAVAISKKSKENDTKAMVLNGRVGTRTEHFLAYISNVMDVLDRNIMKGNI